MPSSRGSSQPWDGTRVFWITGRFCTSEAPGEALYMYVCVCVCVCVCVYSHLFQILCHYRLLLDIEYSSLVVNYLHSNMYLINPILLIF